MRHLVLALPLLLVSPVGATERYLASCKGSVNLPPNHIISPASVSTINTATNEVEMFFDKGAGDGVSPGDVAYPVDCKGQPRPEVAVFITASSKSGSRGTIKAPGYVMKPLKEFVIDTSHGAQPMPSFGFGRPGGYRYGTLTSAKLAKYLGDPSSATSDRFLFPGTIGFVFDPTNTKPTATFKVFETTPANAILTLQLDPSVNEQPQKDSRMIYYTPKTCSFDVAAPDLTKAAPPGHAILPIKQFDPSVDRKGMRITVTKGSNDGLLPWSKFYALKGKGSTNGSATFFVESLTETSAVIYTNVRDPSDLKAKVLAQTATCK